MPIIFPNHVTHSQVCMRDAKVVSAGFVDISKFGTITRVYGEAQSLNMKAKPEDADILSKAMLDLGTASFMTNEQ